MDLSPRRRSLAPEGQTYWSLGVYRNAEECFRRAITPLPLDLPTGAQGLPHFASNARAWLASALAQVGRFGEGVVLGEEALRIARAVDDEFRLIIAYHHLGTLHLHRGTLDDAAMCFNESLSIAHTWEISNYVWWSTAELAVTYARLGRIKDALEWVGTSPAYYSLCRAEVHFLAGQAKEAREAGDQGLTKYRDDGERGLEGWTLRLLGEITASRDPLEVARALPAHLVASDEREMRAEIEARAAARGHPWRSFFSPDEIRELADRAGFASVSLATADDLAGRYFAGREDGLRPNSAAYLMASV